MAHSLRILKRADWFRIGGWLWGSGLDRAIENDNNLDTFNFIDNLIKLLTVTIHVHRTCEIYRCTKLG